MSYEDFLKSKVCLARSSGFIVDPAAINPNLQPHNKVIVPWMLEGGRRALFGSFGLQKTVAQLEVVRLAAEHCQGRGLIVLPLGVRQEFTRDAINRLGWSEPPPFIRDIKDAGPRGVYLTNYETVRDGKLDPNEFKAVSLDEASILRGFGGTKTFREFMALLAGDRKTMDTRERSAGVEYRFVATATPSPNEYIELLAYAAFLGVMDVGAAKTRFFKRDSEKADQLTLHPHKAREFWLWVASWALFITKPSDLGLEFSDEGYYLDVRVPSHKPHRGQRVWIDLTIERAREYAARHVKRMAALGYPPPKGKTEAQLIEELAQHEFVSFGEGISPDLAIAGYDAFKDADE